MHMKKMDSDLHDIHKNNGKAKTLKLPKENSKISLWPQKAQAQKENNNK